MATTFTFALHPDAWLREGTEYADGLVVGYRVGGLPDGSTARIANFSAPAGNEWKVLRIKADNSQTDWTGRYATAEDALDALLREFESH